MPESLSSSNRKVASFWPNEQKRCIILCESMFRVPLTQATILFDPGNVIIPIPSKTLPVL